jgi:hypothetical protein
MNLSCLFCSFFVSHVIYCLLSHLSDYNQEHIRQVRFQVLTAASMKFRIVFWDVLPCKIIVDRRFIGTCYLHHQGSPSSGIIIPDDGGSTYL